MHFGTSRLRWVCTGEDPHVRGDEPVGRSLVVPVVRLRPLVRCRRGRECARGHVRASSRRAARATGAGSQCPQKGTRATEPLRSQLTLGSRSLLESVGALTPRRRPAACPHVCRRASVRAADRGPGGAARVSILTIVDYASDRTCPRPRPARSGGAWTPVEGP